MPCRFTLIYIFLALMNKRHWFPLRLFATEHNHCVKSVQIWSFFWPVNLRIQSEYRKMRTRKDPYLDTFHAVIAVLCKLKIFNYQPSIFMQGKGKNIIVMSENLFCKC